MKFYPVDELNKVLDLMNEKYEKSYKEFAKDEYFISAYANKMKSECIQNLKYELSDMLSSSVVTLNVEKKDIG